MSIALRVLVSAALLALVASHVDWHDIWDATAHARWDWLVGAFVAFNASIVFASKRWQLIVHADGDMGTRIRTKSAITATYISQWLSNFLPTAFGGDVARVVIARRAGAALPHAIASAVLDRFVGIVTLALIFLAVEAALAAGGGRRLFLPVAALLGFGFLVLFLMLWAGAHIPLRRRWLRSRVVRFLARATRVLRTLHVTPAAIAPILLASVMATMLGVLAYWGAIQCVSTGVGFPIALAAAVLGTIASATPVSLSGWGVREGTVAFVLTQAGAMQASDASLVAILNGLVIAATSLVGLAISLTVRWNWRGSGADNGGSPAAGPEERA
jgi:glycosyltransferase 2 family protein